MAKKNPFHPPSASPKSNIAKQNGLPAALAPSLLLVGFLLLAWSFFLPPETAIPGITWSVLCFIVKFSFGTGCFLVGLFVSTARFVLAWAAKSSQAQEWTSYQRFKMLVSRLRPLRERSRLAPSNQSRQVIEANERGRARQGLVLAIQ